MDGRMNEYSIHCQGECCFMRLGMTIMLICNWCLDEIIPGQISQPSALLVELEVSTLAMLISSRMCIFMYKFGYLYFLAQWIEGIIRCERTFIHPTQKALKLYAARMLLLLLVDSTLKLSLKTPN